MGWDLSICRHESSQALANTWVVVCAQTAENTCWTANAFSGPPACMRLRTRPGHGSGYFVPLPHPRGHLKPVLRFCSRQTRPEQEERFELWTVGHRTNDTHTPFTSHCTSNQQPGGSGHSTGLPIEGEAASPPLQPYLLQSVALEELFQALLVIHPTLTVLVRACQQVGLSLSGQFTTQVTTLRFRHFNMTAKFYYLYLTKSDSSHQLCVGIDLAVCGLQ
eukprot:1157940-Pelagomonas_calceolata.AAC.5